MASSRATMAASRMIQSGKASLQLLIHRHRRPTYDAAAAIYQSSDSSVPSIPELKPFLKSSTNPIDDIYRNLKIKENRLFQYPILNQTGASINKCSVEIENKDYYDSDDDSEVSDSDNFNGVDGFDDSDESGSEDYEDEVVDDRYRKK